MGDKRRIRIVGRAHVERWSCGGFGLEFVCLFDVLFGYFGVIMTSPLFILRALSSTG